MAEAPRKRRKTSHEESSEDSDNSSEAAAPIKFTGPSPRITSALQPKVSPPVIVTQNAIRLPKDAEFHSYAQAQPPLARKRRHGESPELLLHSVSHRTMEYTAREDDPNGINSLMNHYIGIYSPTTGDLQVIQAKKMGIRGGVRSHAVQDGQERADTKAHVKRRQELGEAFGTKKAKKAIADVSQNAISSGPRGPNGALGAGELALMDRIKDKASEARTQADLQASFNASRPIPQGNFDAYEIHDVYVPEEFIGADVLNLIPVRDWQTSVKNDEGLNLASRFVANRVIRHAGMPDATQRLRRLRYLLLLIIFWRTTSKGKGRNVWNIAKRKDLREKLQPAPEHVIESIRRKFSEQGEMQKLHVDLLMTHCAALASVIDGYETDVFDLQQDLKLEEKEMSKYFVEIGGTTEVKKVDGRRVRIAKLRMPLQFPKLRVPTRRR